MNVAWIAGLSVVGGILLGIFLMGLEFYLSIDPNELQDDEGTEFLEAILLGHEKFSAP